MILAPPVADFLQTSAPGVLEEANAMAGVFKFVDVGPDLGLPTLVVRRGFAAGCATGMKGDRNGLDANRSGPR
jgi:hypothetical protein